MQTIQEFIQKHQLRMEAVRVPGRPDRFATDWDKTARHFVCTISQEGHGNSERLTITFSQGSAHKKTPTCAEVLDCLAMDAHADGMTFEEWASDYGYDTDSRKALASYEDCKEQAQKLRQLLGREAFRELIEKTERL